jgi:hypothetical protein
VERDPLASVPYIYSEQTYFLAYKCKLVYN